MAGFLSYAFGGGEPPNLPYTPPQMPERFLKPSPAPEMQIREFQRGIVGAKTDWDIADKMVQDWTKQLATPDLTDEDKKKINTEIEGWGKKRDAAAQSAIDYRTQADAMGIDVSDYGAGKTLQEANQAYNTYRNTAIRDFLRLPSVRELEESRYTELLNRGVSPRMAKSIISDERAGRQEDFLRKASEGIMTYGTNPDGQTLNSIGLSMIQKLDPSNPELVGKLFTQGFAMPKDIFSENRADNRVRMTNDAAAQRLVDTLAFNKWHDTFSNEQQNERLKYTVKNQNKQNELDRRSRERIAAANLAIRKISGGSKDSEDKLLAEVASLVKLGIPEDKAAEIVLTQKYSKFFDGLRENKKILEDKVKFGNAVGGQFATIEYFLEKKDYTNAKELIKQFKESIQNPENKYSELAGAADTRALLDRLQKYEDIADGKDTLQALRELEANVTGNSMSSFKRTEQYHRDTGTTDDARKTGEEAARKARENKDHLNDPKTTVYNSNTVITPYGAVTIPRK